MNSGISAASLSLLIGQTVCLGLHVFLVPVFPYRNVKLSLVMYGNLILFFIFLIIMCLVGCFASSSSVASESETSDTQGELRRACSLSDLSKPSPRRLLPSPPNNGIYFYFHFRACRLVNVWNHSFSPFLNVGQLTNIYVRVALKRGILLYLCYTVNAVKS